MPLTKIINLAVMLFIVSTILSGCKKKEPATIIKGDQPKVNNYDFYWQPDYPNAQSIVSFKTKNVPDGATLTWSVDGANHQDNNFKYTFPKGGTYSVKLLVNGDEANSVMKDVVVVPASLYISYTGVKVVGDTIFFNSMRSDGGQHKWDFGDGATSADNDPYHVYTKAGDYTVNLVVTGLEDKPMTSKLYITIVDDPVYTAKMTNKRTWEITRTDFDMAANTSVTQPSFKDSFALAYINKIEVGFPLDNSYLHGNLGYDVHASSSNLLVFTRGQGTISTDTIIYDHVADTIYCKGTVWNVPGGVKSANGKGTTYVMRAQ